MKRSLGFISGVSTLTKIYVAAPVAVRVFGYWGWTDAIPLDFGSFTSFELDHDDLLMTLLERQQVMLQDQGDHHD